MTLQGIDISNWQEGIDLANLTHDIDFVIAKATEGIGYTDRCCDGFIEQAKDLGLLWGFYHFARENDPEQEADYFYNETRNYFTHGIPILDYETQNYDNVEWCEKWLQRIHDLSGVWPILYMSASRCGEFENSWIPEKCGFWCAGYPMAYTSFINSDIPYNTYPFTNPALWQFTSSLQLSGYSGNLDGNIAYMGVEGWHAYAGMTESEPEPSPVQPYKNYRDLVASIMRGEWGNGEDRRYMLENAGYDYDYVQHLVNVEVAALEVIAGKWGNGWNRKQALTGAGYDYQEVQNRVNEILEG